MEREEFIESLADLLAKIEYSALLEDPNKSEVAYKTAYQTVCTRPGSAVETVVRFLRKNKMLDALSEVEENAVIHGLVTQEQIEIFKHPSSFKYIFWLLIGFAAFGVYKFFS